MEINIYVHHWHIVSNIPGAYTLSKSFLLASKVNRCQYLMLECYKPSTSAFTTTCSLTLEQFFLCYNILNEHMLSIIQPTSPQAVCGRVQTLTKISHNVHHGVS